MMKSDDAENYTLRLLQEMRAELRESFAHVEQRFAGVDQRFASIDERFDDLEQRINGNTMILNLIAGGLHDHEHRIASIEACLG